MALSWTRLDTGFFRNRKILQLRRLRNKDAVILWLEGLCYAGEQESSGLIHHEALDTFWCGNAKTASALVEVGLWVPVQEGWLMKNWAKKQPTRLTSEERSQSARDAANARWHGRKDAR